MIVIVGESASGKTAVEKVLSNVYSYRRIVSYTTRPQRRHEQNGVDYHFIPEEEFERLLNDNYFVEHSKYRDWHYGICEEDCESGDIIVANPHGLRQLKRIYPGSVKSFYINTSEKKRLIRLLERGDDILECFKRVISDQGVFQNMEEECDYIINCDDDPPEIIAGLIHRTYEFIDEG